ncbi:MAG: hypothetical protein ACKVHE_04755 [Planctomycetales bacterium]
MVDADAEKVSVLIFVDGELHEKLPPEAGMNPNKAPVLIGANSFFLTPKERKSTNGNAKIDPARQFIGEIDEVAIFSRALTEKEIVRIYEVGTPE